MKIPSLSHLLHRYLMLRLLLPAILLILSIALFSGWQRWQEMQREQQIQTLAIAEYVATYLNTSAEVLTLLAETASLATFPSLSDAYLKKSTSFERILLLTDTGNVLKTFPPAGTLKDYSRLITMAQQKTSTSDLRISSPYLAPLSNQITVSLFSRVVNQQMVVGELNLFNLQNFIAGLGKTEHKAHVFITDRYGTLIAHPDSTLVKQQTNVGHLRSVGLALGGHRGFLGMDILQDVPHLFSAAPVLNGEWMVFTAWNAKALFFSILFLMVSLVLPLSLLLMLTFWFLKQNLDREISQPLARFAQTMEKMERGEINRKQERQDSMEESPFHELDVLHRGFKAMMRAIFEREQALRISEKRFRNLAEALPESVFEIDLDCVITYANPNTLERFGYSRTDIRSGLKLMDFAIKEDKNLIFDHALKVFRNEVAGSLEFEALRKNQLTFPAQMHTSAILIENRVCGLRGFIIDITQTKNKQVQRLEMERRLLHTQKLESLGLLAGGIANDFNNLLAVIQGNLELAMDTIPDKHSVPYTRMGQANVAVQRATDLTRKILAYSGKGQLMAQPININHFIDENQSLLQSLTSKTVTMNLDLTEENLSIMADPGQLQQVLINLVANASEAMEKKAGTLSITTGKRFCDAAFLSRSRLLEKPRAGHFVHITVSDTGSGMDEKNLERIFEPFFSTRLTGRGLGLAAVLGIVHSHGGAIMVKSRPGEGSCFQVFLPALEAPDTYEEETNRLPAPPVLPVNRTQNGIILVVDDEKMVRSLCVEIMKLLDFSTLEAADGEEGLLLFRENSDTILCVIMDLTMPRMDGLTALHAMRRIRPDVKVILCSGYNSDDAVLQLTDKSPTRFLKKPFSITDLQAALTDILALPSA